MWSSIKLRSGFCLALLSNINPSHSQQVAQDPLTLGPPLEPIHYYYDEWPTGIAVSSTGRMFSNYPPALDPTDSNYTVAELTSNTTETPYPSLAMNSPPGGRINYTVYPPVCVGTADYLVGVQSVVIDSKDRLWILDTGRAAFPNGSLPYASYGGPKLVGVDLSTNQVFQTIVFNYDVAYPDSYLNDVRFDLRSSITTSGQGVAYITDSSSEGRNGLIIVDLGTGEAWRHLNQIPQTRPEPGFVVSVWGQTTYMNPGGGTPITNVAFGADGIAISNDGETLYFSVVSGRYLYAVSTARLRDTSVSSELMANAAVMNLGQAGVADGMESDSNGIVYRGNIEQNAIAIFNPQNGTITNYVRDPRIDWTDTFSISGSYLYFTENQLFRGAAMNGGVDKRVKPYVLYRVPLVGNGQKISLQ